MAKDMLEAVFAAEEECKTRENDAKTKASNQKEQAKADAKKIIKEAEQKAYAKAEADFEQAKLDGKDMLGKAKQQAEMQCAVIADTADKNRTKVIDNVVKMILN